MASEEPPHIPPPKDSGYQKFADTVGGVPSLRMKDNLYQGLAVLATTLIGAGLGFFFFIGGATGSFIGGFGGLLFGFFGSGIVLMVLGWIRASK